jgi:diguanylate cyclase (GGDEF)-like protein
MHLLVVEDEPAVAEPLAIALSCLDDQYRISRAATLDRAVRLTERTHFDAALVDLTLPDASNCDIAHALGRTAPHLPIVALTGCDFNAVGLALARAGVQDFLRKGVDSIERIHQSLLLAVERQRQKVMLQQKACYDDLTGTMNRSEIEIQLDKAISHAARSGQFGAVMLIDIDDFKSINDSLGHEAGDAILREVATRITRSVRAGDSVGRFGGDEFVVVIEGLNHAAHAKLIGRKILKACCGSIPAPASRLDVTVSIGIAVFPTEGTSPAVLLRLADVAMYVSKRNGKAALNGADP